MLLNQLINRFEQLWPTQSAEEWDSVGLVVGNRNQQIKKILLTVDVTDEIVAEAKNSNANLILAHHPLLLRGIETAAEETSKGFVLTELIRSGISLYSAHTNADSQPTGTSAVLAKEIGLADTAVLSKNQQGTGIGITGLLPKPISLGELAGLLNDILPQTATGVRVAGDFNRQIQKVALCAGAGDSYLQTALDSAADVYITSDLRHHPAQEILQQAKARGVEFALIDISHWAAEYLWLDQAARELSDLPVEIQVSDLRTDVFDFLLNIPRSK
ncbi:MAG: Nif3-like dinuclear metal center hexameric protein [Rhodoluna sp.]